MKTYRDFKFEKKSGKSYRLIWPGGFKTFVVFSTDEEVKAAIDQIIILFPVSQS